MKPRRTALWGKVASDHEELRQHLVDALEPFTPKHFLRPGDNDPVLIACASAVCDVLAMRFSPGGRPPKKVLDELIRKSLENRRSDVFEMIARGLAKLGNDDRALIGCIDAIDKLGRVPSMAEVMETLKTSGRTMTISTLRNYLRKHDVRLPQSRKNGIEPRRSSR